MPHRFSFVHRVRCEHDCSIVFGARNDCPNLSAARRVEASRRLVQEDDSAVSHHGNCQGESGRENSNQNTIYPVPSLHAAGKLPGKSVASLVQANLSQQLINMLHLFIGRYALGNEKVHEESKQDLIPSFGHKTANALSSSNYPTKCQIVDTIP